MIRYMYRFVDRCFSSWFFSFGEFCFSRFFKWTGILLFYVFGCSEQNEVIKCKRLLQMCILALT